MPESERELLARLEERLQRASDAAESLIAEATARARRPSPGPAASGPGAKTAESGAGEAEDPGERSSSGRRRGPGPGLSGADLELLAQVMGRLRDLVPADLQRRLADAVRELLLAVRALIDWYLERDERARGEPTEVEDIPIR